MRAILAVLALTASGCVCWSQQESCVDARLDRCVESSRAECLDLTGDGGDDDSYVEPDSDPACGGTWKYGSCTSQGYEQDCGDGSFVRRGSRC